MLEIVKTMVKKGCLIFISLLFLLMLPLFSSASFVIEADDGKYNLGENINIQTKIFLTETTNGFLKIQVFCMKGSIIKLDPELVYYAPISIEIGKEKKVTLDYPLNVAGKCYFYASLETTNVVLNTKSNEFFISDSINLDVKLNKEKFNPEEEIKIEGTAIKESGNKLEGKLSFYIDDKPYEIEIKEGKFDYEITLPKNIKSYSHSLNLIAKDINGNYGNSNLEFYINPIPTKIEIRTNNLSFNPGETIIITPILNDQAEDKMNGTSNIALYQKDKLLYSKDVISGESTTYTFDTQAEKNIYNIKVIYNELKQEKEITIGYHYELKAIIEKEKLIIENIGNVKYEKPIKVIFYSSETNQTFNNTLNLSLDVGKKQTYLLEAPEGNYTISLIYPTESIQKEQKFENNFLTGNVVASVSLNPPLISNEMLKYASIFVIAFILILLLIMGLSKRGRKQKYTGQYREIAPPKIKPQSENINESKPIIQEKPKSFEKPRVFHNDFKTNSLNRDSEKQKEIDKLRAESQWFIKRSLRKEGY